MAKEHAENQQNARMHITKTLHAGDVIRTSKGPQALGLIDKLLQQTDMYYPGFSLAEEFESELGEGQVGKSIMCQFHIK